MTIEELKNLAKLSRIKLTEEELNKYAPQMDTIIESVDVLKDIETSNTPVYSPHTTKLSQVREDIVKPGLSKDEALRNAPFTKDGQVIVYGKLAESVDA